MGCQVVHGHSVYAGTALVLLHTLQRRERGRACDHLLHQPVVASGVIGSARRRQGFAAVLTLRSFTPAVQHELQLLGLLAHDPFVSHVRFARPSFGPSRHRCRYYGLG
jgi:hypothetical protein